MKTELSTDEELKDVDFQEGDTWLVVAKAPRTPGPFDVYVCISKKDVLNKVIELMKQGYEPLVSKEYHLMVK